ncbi:MAG: hypothetical protein ACFFEX_02045 [Candidatus Thorarchaeota archaeon]
MYGKSPLKKERGADLINNTLESEDSSVDDHPLVSTVCHIVMYWCFLITLGCETMTIGHSLRV